MPQKRNYKREATLAKKRGEQGTGPGNPNAMRKRARYALTKAGKVRPGDGKDVDHKDGNPTNNSKGNLRVTSKASNRSRNKQRPGKKKVNKRK